MRVGLHLGRMIVILLAVWLAGATAHAQAPRIETCVTKLAEGEDPAAIFAHDSRFLCNTQQNTLGPGNFLAKLMFDPVRGDASDPLVLRLASVWQDRSRITFRFADGSTDQIGFNSVTLKPFITIGAVWEFPIPVKSAPLDGVFIETWGSANVRGVVLSPALMTQSKSNVVKLAMTAVLSAFAGLLVALFVYNLSLWAVLRHKFQLWYCVMATAFALYTFSSSGLPMLIFEGLDNNDRLRINHLLLATAGASALQFFRHFFGGDVFRPSLSRVTHAAIALCMLSALSIVFLAPWQIVILDRIYCIAISIMLAMVVPVLISAWRSGNRYFWMFLLAWTAPLAVTTLRIAHGFNLIEHSILLNHANVLALSVEALLSALLVMARLREISTERDHAVQGERMARRLAATDPLTGLMNRRAFIDQAIGRPGQHRLMLIDIDYFKSVNDRFGHETGDQVLSAVAAVIQRCRPQDSLVVRLGGEEFAMLIPQMFIPSCPPDMVLEAVRSTEMPQGASVTVSIGYADGLMTSEESWKRLYRLADSGLYRAKADGRDRSCRATDFQQAA